MTARERDDIYAALAEEAAAYPAGQPFHSVRALMARFATSQRTVELVLERLMRANRLYRQGRRYYTRDVSAKRAPHYRFFYPDWSSEFIRAYCDAFEDAAAAAQGEFVLSRRGFAISENYLRDLPLDDSDGVFLIPQTRAIVGADLEALAAIPVPTVLLEYDVGGLGLSMVCGDSRSCGMQAAAHLLRQGYSRLAALVTEPPCYVVSERCRGFMEFAGLSGAAAEVIDCNVVTGRLFKGVFYQTLMERLSKRDLDAIFLISAHAALEVYKAVVDSGLRVGPDVGVITSDDLHSNAYMDPPLTSVGYAVGDAVAAAIAGMRALPPTGGCFQERLTPTLTPRASTVRAPSR